MRRLLGQLIVLLALPLAAADTPLSDRPLAPLVVDTVAAAASDDAILAVYAAGSNRYFQRLTLDGTPVDPLARFLGPAANGLTVLWAGDRWAILSGSALWSIDRDGAVDGPFDLGIIPLSATVIRDRVAIITRAPSRPGLNELRVFELAAGNELVWSHSTTWTSTSTSWPIDLLGTTGIATIQTLRFSTSPTETLLSLSAPSVNPPKMLIVPTPTPPLLGQFVPSRSGGGLFIWNDDGLKASVIETDGTFSQAFPVGPRGVVSPQIRAASHDAGWDLLWRIGESTYLARISPAAAASVEVLDAPIPITNRTALVSVPDGQLLLEPRPAPAAGIDVRKIIGSHVGLPAIAGYERAFQGEARSAAGGGFDLVVWVEQGVDGAVLKATRIAPSGLPLDGSGLIVADERVMGGGSNPSFSVSFDGESFVVAWIRLEANYRRSVLMRRISTDGALQAERFVGDTPVPWAVEVEGATEGRAAVAWWGPEPAQPWGHWAVLVPVVRGEPGARVDVATGNLAGSLPRLAAGADGYLAVFHDETRCRLATCGPPVSLPFARRFTFDGTPLGAPLALAMEDDWGWDPDAVSDGSDFFVVWQDNLARLSPDLTSVRKTKLAREGALSFEHGALRIDSELVSATYSPHGTIERFDPLPVLESGDQLERLSRGAFIVRRADSPRRLFIRRAEPAAIADLAVTATGAIVPDSTNRMHLLMFRIEHAGGAPVDRIELWSKNGIVLSGAGEPAKTRIVLDRRLSPGESFEIGVRVDFSYQYEWDGRFWVEPTLWVAADAIDTNVASNHAQYERPTRPRERAVGR